MSTTHKSMSTPSPKPRPTPRYLNRPLCPVALYEQGVERVIQFIEVNNLPPVAFQNILRTSWHVHACAYYRPCTIHICLPLCARPSTPTQVRNWSWPASTTDRTPYGVLCHELAHHIDWCLSKNRGNYFGDFSETLRKTHPCSPLTSYCDNDAEWFAELMRLFITNAALLHLLRPALYHTLTDPDGYALRPVSAANWYTELGRNVPLRILRSIQNKIRQHTKEVQEVL